MFPCTATIQPGRHFFPSKCPPLSSAWNHRCLSFPELSFFLYVLRSHVCAVTAAICDWQRWRSACNCTEPSQVWSHPIGYLLDDDPHSSLPPSPPPEDQSQNSNSSDDTILESPVDHLIFVIHASIHQCETFDRRLYWLHMYLHIGNWSSKLATVYVTT